MAEADSVEEASMAGADTVSVEQATVRKFFWAKPRGRKNIRPAEEATSWNVT